MSAFINSVKQENLLLYRMDHNMYIVVDKVTSQAIGFAKDSKEVLSFPSMSVTYEEMYDKVSWLELLIGLGLSKADILNEFEKWSIITSPNPAFGFEFACKHWDILPEIYLRALSTNKGKQQ